MKREWWIAKYNWHGHYRSDRWRFAYEEDELYKIIENKEEHIHVISASYCESLEREIAALRGIETALANNHKSLAQEYLIEANRIRDERESGELR